MSVELCMCAVGLFLSQWTNYGFGTNDTALAFTFPLYFQIVFTGITLLLVPALPESPRWLVSRGQLKKAATILARLGSKDATEDSEEVRVKLMEMEEMALLEDLEGLAYFKSLVRIYAILNGNMEADILSSQVNSGPTQNGKRALMACLIFIFTQLSGVSIFLSLARATTDCDI
jgi:hypothetical protein